MKKPTLKKLLKLREKHSVKEMAEMFNVSKTTIYYWINPAYRERHIEIVKKYIKNVYSKTENFKKYQREYFKRKYHENKK